MLGTSGAILILMTASDIGITTITIFRSLPITFHTTGGVTRYLTTPVRTSKSQSRK